MNLIKLVLVFALVFLLSCTEKSNDGKVDVSNNLSPDDKKVRLTHAQVDSDMYIIYISDPFAPLTQVTEKLLQEALQHVEQITSNYKEHEVFITHWNHPLQNEHREQLFYRLILSLTTKTKEEAPIL